MDVHTLYIDFRKAFDMVNHQLLILKLRSYGIHKMYLNIFKDFLSNRKQYTRCNGYCSSEVDYLSGVPQGSLFAPLLFNIFIGDLFSKLTCGYISYADDVKIFSTVNASSYHEDTSHLQENLNLVFDWSKCNHLPININKSFFMVYTKNKTTHSDISNTITYYVNDCPLVMTNTTEDLEVIMDNNLNFT